MPSSTSRPQPPSPNRRTRKSSATVKPSARLFLRGGGNFLGFAKSGNGIPQTAHNALLAKYDHGIEERRRNRLPNDGHARRIDQQAGFYAARFGNGTRCVIASVVVPLAERFQRIREFREEFRRFRIFPEFCDGRGIAREIIAEKSARPRRKIRQQPDARPQ